MSVNVFLTNSIYNNYNRSEGWTGYCVGYRGVYAGPGICTQAARWRHPVHTGTAIQCGSGFEKVWIRESSKIDRLFRHL